MSDDALRGTIHCMNHPGITPWSQGKHAHTVPTAVGTPGMERGHPNGPTRSPGAVRSLPTTLLRLLGAGGMAEVFLERQAGLEGFEKLVVIKRVLRATPGMKSSPACSWNMDG